MRLRDGSKLVGAFAMALAVGITGAYAKCKDGETDKVAKYTLSKGENLDHAIKASLTGKPGDPERGVKWMVHRRQGNCIACHEATSILKRVKPNDISSQRKYGFHGKIGPSLDGVADRYTEGELRLIVVDIKKALPDADSIMPSFHAIKTNRVIKGCTGKAVLSADRVEDIVAFLKTLKDG